MRKILCLIFIASVVLTACQKELSFEAASGTGNTGGTTGTTTGSSSSTDCKSCVYMPVCDGSVYTYADTLYGTTSLATDTMRYVKDTTIDSKTFVKIYSPLSKSNTYYNCTDGATRALTYNANTFGGSSITVADITFIKANLPVGGTWQDQLINPAGQSVLYNSKIKEKDVTRTLNGHTFNDVIHVSVETGIDVPGFGFTVFSTSDYYFAKSVGMLETILREPTSGTVFEHRVIKSYSIP